MELVIILGLIVILVLVFRSNRKQNPDEAAWSTAPAALNRREVDEDPQKDAWEFNGWEDDEVVPVSKSLDIEYKDANDRITSRLVDVNQCMFSPGGGGMLKCYCHLRNGIRYFRFDRILSATDVSSGEVISDVRSYLESVYESSPARAIKRMLEEYAYAIQLLLYVGRTDGQLRKAEREVIHGVFRHLINDDRITAEEIDREINSYGAPSLQTFRVAVGKAAAQGDDMKALMYKSAEAIVGTQKAVHAHETEALDYLKKRFGMVST